MKTFLDYLDENYLEPGTTLKKGKEELKVVKPVGKDKYLVKEDELDESTSHTMEAHGVKGMKNTPWRKTFKSHASAKAALASHPLKKHLVIEEVELTEAKHRVSVTVSDPNHTAVSKRKEQTLKTVRVSAENGSDAVTKAKAFYKKQGYKVHDAAHAGMVHEEVEETDESTVIRTQNGRKMVSAEVAIRLAREIAARRKGKEGEKATTNDLKQATKALTREEAEQIDGD